MLEPALRSAPDLGRSAVLVAKRTPWVLMHGRASELQVPALAVNTSIAACFVIFCVLGHPVAAAYCTLQCQQTEADRAGKHCGAKKAADEASRVFTGSAAICDHDAVVVTTVTDWHAVSRHDQSNDFFLAPTRKHSATAGSTARLHRGAHEPPGSPTLNLPLRI